MKLKTIEIHTFSIQICDGLFGLRKRKNDNSFVELRFIDNTEKEPIAQKTYSDVSCRIWRI